MTDPTTAMDSFQRHILADGPPPHRGILDGTLVVHRDHPNGAVRFTYAKLQGRTVAAFVELVLIDPINDIPCFHIGYVVPERYRNQGRAKALVAAAILEQTHGLAQSGITEFCIDAVVGTDNEPSQRVAARTLSDTPTPITDKFSGLPALHSVRKIVAEVSC